jgi:hypothetical protein
MDQMGYRTTNALFNWSRDMRLTKTLTAAVLASLVAGSAIAGGFAQEVVEAPVVIVEPVAETSSWGIILPLAALGLLVALAVSSDDSEDETTDAE